MRSSVFIAVGLAVIITLVIYASTIGTFIENSLGIMTRSQFIDKYADAIKKAVKGTGLFPSVMMAQALLESRNGNSALSKKYNNFFGIKADKSWAGPKVNLPTREVGNGKQAYMINGKSVVIPAGQEAMVDAWFRTYKTPFEGFADRVKFLQSFSRYKNLFGVGTPEMQDQLLLQDGYATDPKYASELNSIISSNNLKTLDT